MNSSPLPVRSRLARGSAQVGLLSSLRAYAHDDFPEHPLATGCNLLQRQQMISVGLQNYPEIQRDYVHILATTFPSVRSLVS